MFKSLANKNTTLRTSMRVTICALWRLTSFDAYNFILLSSTCTWIMAIFVNTYAFYGMGVVMCCLQQTCNASPQNRVSLIKNRKAVRHSCESRHWPENRSRTLAPTIRSWPPSVDSFSSSTHSQWLTQVAPMRTALSASDRHMRASSCWPV